MKRKSRTVLFSKNHRLSLAVRDKFFLLLILTLALMFDTISDRQSFRLFDNQSLPEIPTVK
ncbi:hypothetical protein IQ255_16910 [Pleurocapsales cyanobacterium LEGE 10410]|nr:hypothetical protein [Pleurocapsales cyanobacterium LEGE 10410]